MMLSVSSNFIGNYFSVIIWLGLIVVVWVVFICYNNGESVIVVNSWWCEIRGKLFINK